MTDLSQNCFKIVRFEFDRLNRERGLPTTQLQRAKCNEGLLVNLWLLGRSWLYHRLVTTTCHTLACRKGTGVAWFGSAGGAEAELPPYSTSKRFLPLRVCAPGGMCAPGGVCGVCLFVLYNVVACTSAVGMTDLLQNCFKVMRFEFDRSNRERGLPTTQLQRAKCNQGLFVNLWLLGPSWFNYRLVTTTYQVSYTSM